MGFINVAERTINAKLVYYGVGVGGKTTSLQQVHGIAPGDRIALLSKNTAHWLMSDFAIWLAGGSLIAHVGVAGAAMHAAWQLARFDHANSARCLKLFRSNRIFGLIITLGLLLDSLIT